MSTESTPKPPRRCDMLRWSPAERAIYDATQLVEAVGAHPLLTEAVTLLGQARERVADYVDHPAPYRSALASAWDDPTT